MTSRAGVTAGEWWEDKGKGVGRRILSRMKTVLKRSDTSKRQTTQATAPTPQPAVAAPSTATISPSQIQQLESDSAAPRADGPPPAFAGEKVARAQIYNERSQLLSDRFGLEMDPNDRYQMDGHVLRVHKPLRMRVHRQCHQCGGELKATTGACDKCDHSFCRQCTRYPPKRNETEMAASRDRRAEILEERATNAMIPSDLDLDLELDLNPSSTVVLRRPVKPCVQKELVYKKVRQRVKRMCCQCQDAGEAVVVFHGGTRNCPKCDHVRCTDCPRDPPKKDKYPYGYPGDEFGAKSIPHYRCHECFSDYPPGVQSETPCSNCSHGKCDTCERLRPQKVEPALDPEATRSVQEKLARLNFA